MWNNIRTILTTALGMVLIMLAIFQWPIIAEQKNVAQITIRYPVETGELVNPYIGNAVWAENDGEHEQPFTLVYANLTWAGIGTPPRRICIRGVRTTDALRCVAQSGQAYGVAFCNGRSG